MQNFNGDFNPLFVNDVETNSDPFSTKSGGIEESNNFKVHLRIQKRSGRKSITIIEGLPDEINAKKITKILRKTLCCIGTAKKDSDGNQIIQLTGDQREEVARIFVEDEIVADKSYIVMHGF